jgi:DNA-binding CsgD family transcriptional regulator/tetratricopeptide (TPR) repeat protein
LYGLTLRYAAELPEAQRAQLLDEYSVECDVADRRPEAIDTRRQAAALWLEAGNPLKHGASLSRVAQLLQIIGNLTEAERVNAMALAVLEPLTPNLELVTAYNTQAWLCLAQTDNRQGVAVAEKALALAQHFEAEEELPRLYEILGLCWLYLDHARGSKYLERSLVLARELDHSIRAANIYANLSSIYVDFHEFRRAADTFAAGLPYASERDLDSVRVYMLGWQAILEVHLGHWDKAAEIANELVQRPGTSPGRGPALLALGRLRARRGDPAAKTALDESLAILIKQGFRQREGLIRAARAEAAWLAGDRKRALEEARLAYDLALSHRHEWYVGELAFWRWRAGDPVPLPDWTAKPYALHINGDWRAAAEEWARLGCPYEQARALADGDTAAQIVALEILNRLGARPLADELRQKLRAAGARDVPRKPRASTLENPFGLTGRQLEILGLLMAGLSNAAIAAQLHLSSKTVDHHVSAVLARLDVHSREEAAELARRHPHLQRPAK